MKIFIDTNVLISAALFPTSKPAQAVEIATSQTGIICEQNIDELVETFYKKFPDRFASLVVFLLRKSEHLLLVPTATEINATEQKIRDVKDRPILRTAIKEEVDLFLTGDKDFLESEVKHPKIINVSDFLELMKK